MSGETDPVPGSSAVDRFLLDTNILIHYVRDDEVKNRVEKQYALLMTPIVPLISSVVEGEIRSLAMQWNWGKRKVDQMGFLLSAFPKVPIERPEIMEAYALIDSYSKLGGWDMGKNDLWIAATARVTGATLITTDKDFDHLDATFLSRIWFDPDI